ncbi:MAG: hypothetical protein ACRC1H_02395 [Caldilineaceae bacterium]
MTIIATRDDIVAAAKRILPLYKTTTRTTVAGGWFSMFDVAGNPGAGTLAGVGANGRIEDDSMSGYPIIPFSGGHTYLSRLSLSNTVVSQIAIYDRLWVGGPYAFNANQAVVSPSWASRVSYANGQPDYTGLELWVETVTAATGNQTWNVTYTDDSGGTGAVTGATGIGAAPTAGRCWQLPLAAGDSGLQAVTNVAGGTGSAGTANIMVLRPLIRLYLPTANQLILLNWADLGLPELFNNSALYFMVMAPSGTSSGSPWAEAQVANKP